MYFFEESRPADVYFWIKIFPDQLYVLIVFQLRRSSGDFDMVLFIGLKVFRKNYRSDALFLVFRQYADQVKIHGVILSSPVPARKPMSSPTGTLTRVIMTSM